MKFTTISPRIFLSITILLLFAFLVFFGHTATAQALLKVGQQAPDFSLQDVEGKATVSLSQFKDKKVIAIVFWSTWSTNSTKALKRMESFYRGNKDAMQVIAVNADNQNMTQGDLDAVKKTIGDLGITFPVLIDKGLKVFHEYNTIALPSTVVLVDGKIAYEMPGLPLVGTEKLFDFMLIQMGKKQVKEADTGYKPVPAAIADTNLARGFIKKGNTKSALPLLKNAMTKDPRYMPAYIEAARLYQNDNKAAEAEAVLRSALKIEPDNGMVLGELGYLLAKTQKTKEALDILSTAAKLESYAPSNYYYAYALGKEGRYKESIAAFEGAFMPNRYSPVFYLLRAEIYEDNGQSKEASEDYKRALELYLKIK